MPQSSASRIVAELEREIGARLLARTTRAVSLTEAGADFLARLDPILADLEEAEQLARGSGELRGVLRIALGSSLAVREVIPRLPMLLERHPRLRLDMLLEDQRQDLITDGVDMALRFGPLAESTATACSIRAWPRMLSASPRYLEAAGMPTTPADLSAHLVIMGPASVTANWTFRRGATTTSVRVDGPLRISGNEGAIAAAVAGLGVIMTSSGAVRREMERGELVRILEDWDLGAHELNAIFVGGPWRQARRPRPGGLSRRCTAGRLNAVAVRGLRPGRRMDEPGRGFHLQRPDLDHTREPRRRRGRRPF